MQAPLSFGLFGTLGRRFGLGESSCALPFLLGVLLGLDDLGTMPTRRPYSWKKKSPVCESGMHRSPLRQTKFDGGQLRRNQRRNWAPSCCDGLNLVLEKRLRWVLDQRENTCHVKNNVPRMPRSRLVP